MTPEEEKQLLLQVVTKLAAKLIGEGGFVPFGATLGPGRSVNLLMPKNWKENATRNECEDYWSRELKKATANGDCKSVCSCADVRIPMNSGDLAHRLLIHIEHAQSCSEDIGIPYVKDGDSGVRLGAPTSVKTEAKVFTIKES